MQGSPSEASNGASLDPGRAPRDPFGRAPRLAAPGAAGSDPTRADDPARRDDPAGRDGAAEPTAAGPASDSAPESSARRGDRSAARVAIAATDAALGDALVHQLGDAPWSTRATLVPPTDAAPGCDVLVAEVRDGSDAALLLERLGSGEQRRVVVLDRRGEARARVALLRAGVDHVLDADASTEEVAACVGVHLRRLALVPAPSSGGTRPARIEVEDGLVVDLGRMQIERDGTRLDLTPLEAGILGHVIENADRVVARDEILEAVWGPRETRACARTVDVHVVALRRKLHGESGSQRLLRTVRGLGYRWCG